jgi:nucleoside-diphosphate-sugar epimerase
MRVLVVGGTRFLGHELSWRLLAAGHRVTLFNRGTLPDTFGPRVERLRGDRTTADFARLLAGREWDAAVDFAAFDGRDGRQAAEVLDGRVGHYVAISTGQVYLVREERRAAPATESDFDGPVMRAPVDPFDRGQWDYGMGKREMEDALADAWVKRRFPATRLRIPMVNGERDHFRRLERYLWRFIDGGPVLLPGGGERRVRHVYSGSVVKLVLSILGAAETFGGAWNLAQDETPTLRELLALLARSLGTEPRLVDVPEQSVLSAGLDPLLFSPFSGHWMSFLDPSRARQELGFRHEPLPVYVDRIVASFLAHPPADPPPGLDRRADEAALAARVARS